MKLVLYFNTQGADFQFRRIASYCGSIVSRGNAAQTMATT